MAVQKTKVQKIADIIWRALDSQGGGSLNKEEVIKKIKEEMPDATLGEIIRGWELAVY